MMPSASPSLLWINHFAVTPADGGGTRHVELGRELVGLGWQVTIAASDFHLHTRGYTRRQSASDRAPVHEHLDGVDLAWLWAAPYTRNDWKRGWNWASFGRSVTAWESQPNAPRPDLVIGSSPHLFAALAGLRVARRLGVPFVLEVRDLWPESLLAVGARKGPLYHSLAAIARYLYRRADRIIVLAPGVGRYLEKRGVPHERIVYVPNGADVEQFNDRPDQRSDRFTAIYAGAHGPANGLDAVLDAAALLRDVPQLRIRLLGDGPSKAALKARASSLQLANVEFLDPVPKAELASVLASADVGLMVLRDAPLFAFGVSPNKLFDYLAAQLPVVCNVPGDVAAMLRQSAAGVQAADASGAGLAAALRQVARLSPEQRMHMGDAGRRWVEAEHSRAVLAARLDVALRALLAHGLVRAPTAA